MALVVDTGPLYASIDRRDVDHARCRRLLDETREEIFIPAAVLPEVDYWVRQRGGVGAFLALLEDIARGAYTVANLDAADFGRVHELCDRYADSDIGFVDAAVFATVERLGESKLATLDHRHFAMMRPRHVEALELLPS